MDEKKALSKSFSEPTKPSSERHDERAFQVWAQMVELFGARWTTTYGPTPGPMWRAVTAEMNDAQIRRGMNALLNSGAVHPPSLPEWKELCCGQSGIARESIEALAYALIPSFDRANLSRVALNDMTRRNVSRAADLLNGEAQPTEREGNILKSIGMPMSALVRQ